MQDRGTTLPANGSTLLLPWHAAGTLSPSQSIRVNAAIRADVALEREAMACRRERAAVVEINDSLGEPSPRALLALFAAIDADGGRGEKIR